MSGDTVQLGGSITAGNTRVIGLDSTASLHVTYPNAGVGLLIFGGADSTGSGGVASIASPLGFSGITVDDNRIEILAGNGSNTILVLPDSTTLSTKAVLDFTQADPDVTDLELIQKQYADATYALASANSGDVTLSGETYLSIAGQVITAASVNLSDTHVTGTLAAARFGALTGDVTTAGGSYATTIANNAVTGAKIAMGSDAAGDLLYYNGTDYVRLPIGTASQQLRVNAGATAPEWATIGESGTVTDFIFTDGGGFDGTVTTSTTTPTLSLTLQDAAADGTTKGQSTFTAADFNASAGLISIDYTNGQAASGSTKGFLTSADWTTFNSKGVGDILNGGNTTGATVVVGTNDAQRLDLEANNAAALTVASGGNIGIGTTAPTTGKLEIVGGTLTDTKNIFRLTATMPSAPAGQNYMNDIQLTGAGSTNQIFVGFNLDLNAGYTGVAYNSLCRMVNATAGTGVGIASVAGNVGNTAGSVGTTVGSNVGVLAVAANGNKNAGLTGSAVTAKNSATNVGVVGVGLNTGSSPVQVGGFFGLMSTDPTFTSAALIADNGGTTSPIFVARDNGTAFFQILDGGSVSIGSSNAATLTNAGIVALTTYTINNSWGAITFTSTGPDISNTNPAVAATAGVTFGSGQTFTQTSATRNYVSLPYSFAPTSGTAVHNQFAFTGTFNQTGGASGITRSIYINPTLTAVADYRAIEFTSSTTNAKFLYHSGTAPSVIVGKTHFGSTTAPTAQLQVSQTATATGALTGIVYTGAVNTNQTLSTEIPACDCCQGIPASVARNFHDVSRDCQCGSRYSKRCCVRG